MQHRSQFLYTTIRRDSVMSKSTERPANGHDNGIMTQSSIDIDAL